MRDNIKLFIKYVMRFILHIYWIFPINKKRIFFMSTFGKSYSCNPKYIYKSIIQDERFKDYNLIWCFINPEEIEEKFNNNVKIIKKSNYLVYFYYLLTSRVVIYNCGGFSYAPIRNNQLLIETWHGGGAFKNVGLTVENKSFASKKGIMIASKEIKLFISSCGLSTNTLIRSSMAYNGEVLQSGMPRNDILVNQSEEKKKEIRERLKLDSETKIILYAPTFKGSEHKAVNISSDHEIINPFIIKELLEKRYNCKWKFAMRGHQYANASKLDGADYDWSSYPDMQELLLIADVLITDYSSSIWDFSIMKKMCLLYVPDLNNYEKNERGFITPFDKWPGIPVYTNSEFEKVIMNFDKYAYMDKIDNFIKYSNSYEKGTACEQVKTYILKDLGMQE